VTEQDRTLIRPAVPGGDDEAFLREMLYQSIHVPPGEASPSRSVMDSPMFTRYVAGRGRIGDRAYIAEIDGIAVGAAWSRLFTASEPGYGFVAADIPELGVAVLEPARGRGVGSSLIERLITQAGLDGFGAISLSVDPSNPALRLYERLGFRRVDADDGGSWTMLLPLSRDASGAT
jgi:GNAT superfamily N-acetyltransferase